MNAFVLHSGGKAAAADEPLHRRHGSPRAPPCSAQCEGAPSDHTGQPQHARNMQFAQCATTARMSIRPPSMLPPEAPAARCCRAATARPGSGPFLQPQTQQLRQLPPMQQLPPLVLRRACGVQLRSLGHKAAPALQCSRSRAGRLAVALGCKGSCRGRPAGSAAEPASLEQRRPCSTHVRKLSSISKLPYL